MLNHANYFQQMTDWGGSSLILLIYSLFLGFTPKILNG